MTGPGGSAALSLRGVTKFFGDVAALDKVDLDVAPCAIHGLLGANGSGKSTLIKILAGVCHAERGGSLTVHGRKYATEDFTPSDSAAAGLRFVHQDLGLFPELSVAENLALARGYPRGAGRRVNWRRLRSEAGHMLELYEVPAGPDERVADLRPSTRAMVAIARALGPGDDDGRTVLVLDEPTASLPAREVDILLTALRARAASGHAILYVSHRIQELFGFVTHFTVLRDGRVRASEAYGRLSQYDLAELITGKRSSAGRSSGVRPEAPRPPRHPAASPPRLEARNLGVGPLRRMSFRVGASEIVGLAGAAGAGRSTLLHGLFGALPLSGEVLIDGIRTRISSPAQAMRAGLTLVPEDRHADAAFPDMSVRENLSATVLPRYRRWMRLSRRREAQDARQLITKYDVKTPSLDALFSSLSGGNQQKVIVARCLQRAPKVLLLDEPTQGVDIAAKMELYALLRSAADNGSGILVASSDYDELAELCDRIILIQENTMPAAAPDRFADGTAISRAVLTIWDSGAA